MVVTRFAPSPTGYLHIGGARTALFNWLWARKNGGQFILRIEDTDTKRNTPTAAQQVVDDLKWLGINWDQGPEVGGENGPYHQSERLDIYEKYIQQLLDDGKAYYCFETSEELQAIRDKCAAAKQNLVYPRPEKFPDAADVARAKEQGRAVTVRFAIPHKEIVVRDIIRNEVKFNGAELGDFIIRKSDGFPTYNFAVVVDDALMGVSHVLRGQEHLMNTPGQQELWQALGLGELPQYAHMSVTISESGGKLSKRERPKVLKAAIRQIAELDVEALAAAGGITADEYASFMKKKGTADMPVIDAMAGYLGVHLPEINVVDFQRSGYLPETLVNFMALLGWNPGDDREIMSIDELVESFDVSRLVKSNSLFDRKKLVSFNTEHIRTADNAKLIGYLRDYLKVNESPVLAADDEMLGTLLRVNAGARTLADIDKKCRFLFVDNDKIDYDKKAVKKVLLKAGAIEMLGLVGERLAGLAEITEQSMEDMLRGLATEKEVGLGKVAQPLRVAITGTTVSPPIFDSVALLGRENTLERIDIAIKKFGESA